MISKKIEIRNSIGLHARPAVMIASEASKYRSQILLRHGDFLVNAKSSVRVLAMAVNCGETIELVVAGEDESVAFEKLSTILDTINEMDI